MRKTTPSAGGQPIPFACFIDFVHTVLLALCGGPPPLLLPPVSQLTNHLGLPGIAWGCLGIACLGNRRPAQGAFYDVIATVWPGVANTRASACSHASAAGPCLTPTDTRACSSAALPRAPCPLPVWRVGRLVPCLCGV